MTINGNQLPDFPLTGYDIISAGFIFGPNLGYLNGKKLEGHHHHQW